MSLNCANSYVDGSQIRTFGRVIVCLQTDSGSPYFDGFDIGGGQANNGAAATTGFITGSSNLTQDYLVDPGDEGPNHQCFYVDYVPQAGATSDQLVLQRTGSDSNPSGDACSFQFTIPPVDGGGDPVLSCGNSNWT